MSPSGSWQSSTAKFASLYATFFTLSLVLLLGFVGYSITSTMERSTDVVIKWELNYFDSFPDDEVEHAIQNRLEHERLHANYYGLFSADGHRIAGDVLAIPGDVRIGREGVTLKHTLRIDRAQTSPVMRVMAERRRDGRILVVAHDLTHYLSIRENSIDALVLGGALCLALGALVAFLLTQRQMARIKEVRAATRAIAGGDLSRRLPVSGRDEFDMLAHLVNHMLGEVERLMGEVKGACDGIAHDLRTPLAHVRTRLSQVASRAVRYSDIELETEIANVRQDVDRLLETFRAMMRVSEIGTLDRRRAFEEIDLAQLLGDVWELYDPLAESCGVKLTVDTRADAPIFGDRALLFEAFSNIVDNAVKFSPAGSAVSIVLRGTPSGIAVDVIDSGPGIPAEEREAVLQRFYRSERTRHLPGTGLGLSIVSAIINLHDFGIHISDAEPGATITVQCCSQVSS
ncbi:signal transduction histidine kinase [Paraburkholderia unamae]|uniref:sensor histidine kinase n=1 Tax=Paraburkholderia unamae TaxID=219649 RepID=UPI000DC4E4DD|nr:HAMP domain-containing sensor histidine kinase [Paraburkholderia unamae]RAR57129.1 signal transduction histidine kinase [Paraburkholderia unamae]